MFLRSFQNFWFRYPALLYGLAMLIGITAALNWNPVLLLPLVLITIPTFSYKKILLTLGIVCAAFFYVKVSYLFPNASEGIVGEAHIQISSLATKTTHFGKQWVYKGNIRSFETPEGILAKNIPFVITLPQNAEIIRPASDKEYIVSATLKEISPGYFTLIPLKNTPWIPLQGSWSSSEIRFKAKQMVGKYIHNSISNHRTATFLSGIATGDFDDRLMVFEFGRFGLQHIMAISGFHFAIIAAILSIILKFVIGRKKAVPLLIFLLSSYFIFLGPSASVMRAWIAILIVLCGFIFGKEGSGLNSLGIGMIVVLLIDPLLSRSIGFQFSFAVTAAILLFFPLIDYAFQQLLKKRDLSEAIEMNFLNQHAYCVLSFLRQALSLTLAVNLIALPMTFYAFQKFPLLSLVYNLFFPFLVSLSMLLLIVAMLFSVIPPLGKLIHLINTSYTEFMLNFVYNVPTSIDVNLRFSNFSFEFLICFLCIIFGIGICLKELLDTLQESNEAFTFL